MSKNDDSGSESISVIICTCDRYDVLPGAIDSILKQTRMPDELIVVDNSIDAGKAMAFGEKFRSNRNIRYMHEPVQGLSRARNRGISVATSDIVAFVDDDAIAAPDWVENLIKAFADYPEAAVVGGRITPRWLAPRPAWLASDRLLGHLSIVDWAGPTRTLAPGEWLAGCNISFRRELLKKAGGFPENLGRVGVEAMLLSNEELAVCGKIQSMGGSVFYSAAATVEHLIGPVRLNKEWFLRRTAWQAISDFITLSHTPPRSTTAGRLVFGLAGIFPYLGNFEARTDVLYDLTIQRLKEKPELIEKISPKGDFLIEVLDLKPRQLACKERR